MATTAAAQPAQKETTFWDELNSLKTPAHKEVTPAPKVGSLAPKSDKIPFSDGKPTVILFLRHCGCPFAEKTFKALTSLSNEHKDAHFIAVSHSTEDHTARWVPLVGGEWETEVIVDEERDLYAQWGLGISTTWHVFNPWSLYSVFKMGKEEDIWNKPTESGNRWQTSGAFAIGADGTVRWEHISKTADDIPDLKAAVGALGLTGRK